jgi:hypothetical protein
MRTPALMFAALLSGCAAAPLTVPPAEPPPPASTPSPPATPLPPVATVLTGTCLTTIYETTGKYRVSPELVDAIPIQIEAHGDPVSFTTAISLPIGDVAPGDILQGHAEAEVTNDTGGNVMIMGALIIAASQSATDGEAVAPWNGINVSPDMHHGVVSKNEIHAARQPQPDARANLVLRAGRTSPTPNGTAAMLTVERGYGEISVAKTHCAP